MNTGALRRWQRRALRHAELAARLAFVSPVVVMLGWGLLQRKVPAVALPVVLAGGFAGFAARAWARWMRERLVREAPMPQFLKRKLREAHPALTGKDCDLVERGLRQFFFACQRAPGQFVAMPSRAVDALWHEFILHTRAYEEWCDLTLGRFLHHTPAEALGPNAKGNDGLRRAWFWACRDEAIDPRRPTRLPLLFALDAKLGFAKGFTYVPDCRDIARKSDQGGDGGGTYCGTDFSGDSFSGDGDGFGGSDPGGDGSGDGGSDGGGDGGGGGCGGGD